MADSLESSEAWNNPDYASHSYATFAKTLMMVVGTLVVLRTYTSLAKGKCQSSAQMDGKTVIVTGANTGSCIAVTCNH